MSSPGDIHAINDRFDQIDELHKGNPAMAELMKEVHGEFEINQMKKTVGDSANIEALKRGAGTDEQEDTVNRAFKDGVLDWGDMPSPYATSKA